MRLLNFYIAAYAAGVAFLGYWCLFIAVKAAPRAAYSAALAINSPMRGLLLVGILNLAGLPPLVFFAAKLGLLALCCSGTSVWGYCLAISLVWVGWVGYAGFLRAQLGMRDQTHLMSPL